MSSAYRRGGLFSKSLIWSGVSLELKDKKICLLIPHPAKVNVDSLSCVEVQRTTNPMFRYSTRVLYLNIGFSTQGSQNRKFSNQFENVCSCQPLPRLDATAIKTPFLIATFTLFSILCRCHDEYSNVC